MDAFLADASPREVLALAREWARFSALIDGMPVARVRTILRDRFGCGWLVPRVADLRAVFRKLEPPRPQP